MKIDFLKKTGNKCESILKNINVKVKTNLSKLKTKNNNSSHGEIKKNKEYYIKQLENENARLLGESKIADRQIKRELASYLEPMLNIFSNIDFKDCNVESFSYIKTQLESFLLEKELEIYKPKIMEPHNKDEMIVVDFINTNKEKYSGLIEKVIAFGIKDKNNKIIVPAKVRIYKGSEK